MFITNVLAAALLVGGLSAAAIGQALAGNKDEAFSVAAMKAAGVIK